MKIRKAIITAAGFGTRFLPISKTIQKEMLPILNRPTIDFLVADCVAAGIEEIIFVVKESENRLVEHFYTEYRSLRQHLEKMGKLETHADSLSFGAYDKVKFRFVDQTIADQYGTAMPVALAERHLKNEDAFVVLMGDDFLLNPDGSSETAKMIAYFNAHPTARGLATCLPKPTEELYKYGVADTYQENDALYLKTLVEKPTPGTAPSNLVNISKYIFTPAVFDIIRTQTPNQASGELYITDSITTLANLNSVLIYEPTGTYLDAGTVSGWLKANLTVAATNDELKQELQTFLSETKILD